HRQARLSPRRRSERKSSPGLGLGLVRWRAARLVQAPRRPFSVTSIVIKGDDGFAERIEDDVSWADVGVDSVPVHSRISPPALTGTPPCRGRRFSYGRRMSSEQRTTATNVPRV